uniref:Uncharacterized protein n=1 Tax=Anopheles atroparvus TaxID=41427 RepID=A0A182J979_ANOAO
MVLVLVVVIEKELLVLLLLLLLLVLMGLIVVKSMKFKNPSPTLTTLPRPQTPLASPPNETTVTTFELGDAPVALDTLNPLAPVAPGPLEPALELQPPGTLLPRTVLPPSSPPPLFWLSGYFFAVVVVVVSVAAAAAAAAPPPDASAVINTNRSAAPGATTCTSALCPLFGSSAGFGWVPSPFSRFASATGRSIWSFTSPPHGATSSAVSSPLESVNCGTVGRWSMSWGWLKLASKWESSPPRTSSRSMGGRLEGKEDAASTSGFESGSRKQKPDSQFQDTNTHAHTAHDTEGKTARTTGNGSTPRTPRVVVGRAVSRHLCCPGAPANCTVRAVNLAGTSKSLFGNLLPVQPGAVL